MVLWHSVGSVSLSLVAVAGSILSGDFTFLFSQSILFGAAHTYTPYSKMTANLLLFYMHVN